MRILLAVTAASVLALTANVSSASAKDSYVSVAGGATGESHYDITFAGANARVNNEAGVAFAAAWGKKLSQNLRGEIAVSASRQDTKSLTVSYLGDSEAGSLDGKTEAYGIDGNVYYDFPVKGKFVPYVGAGVGVSNLKLTILDADSSTSVLHLQAIAGVNYAVNPKFNLFAEVRAQRLGSFKFKLDANNETKDTSISTTGVLVGLRAPF